MHIDKKSSVLLGLCANDVTILKALSFKEQAVSDLALSTQIPRTSLYYMLPRLQERGFLEKVRRSRKILWRKASDEDICNAYEEALKRFKGASDAENGGGSSEVRAISDAARIGLYQGNEKVLTVFDEILSMPPKSRFFGIQPEQSIIAAVTRNPIEKIISFNQRINAKRMIVEGIVHERGTDSMFAALPENEGLELLRSFANRSADTAKLPNNFLNKTKAEIYLYEDKVAIVNWHEEFAVIIENKDVFELVKEMFNSTKYLLGKYDQNEKIARKLIDFDSE